MDTFNNYIHCDTATKTDSIGFKLYVEAIAEFLTSEDTRPPLTLSIEGQWGCGKSSFMLQLEEEIKKINSTKGKKDFTIHFNSWRHDKEDELWAAFALTLIENLSEQLSFTQNLCARLKLTALRLNFKLKGKSSFGTNIFLLIILLCITSLYSVPTFYEVISSESTDGILKNLLVIIIGFIGPILPIFYIGKDLIDVIENTFDFNKYVSSPNYEEHISFIEQFHSDFNKIIESYAGKSKVYVFIDDLDRCEIPKAAELMKAINLMISDNPNIYFIIAMDRKVIAAGIASRQNEVFSYLTDDKLKYGYEFVEKFIQFPFKVPSPKSNDYEELLFGKDDFKESVKKFKKFVLGKEDTLEHIEEMDSSGDSDCKEIFKNNRSSENFKNILKMVSPALDNNPRRIKHFHNMFRFHYYIGSKTGLFYSKDSIYNVWNCKKLAKFITISIMCPSLIFALSFDRTLFDKLQVYALKNKTNLNELNENLQEDQSLKIWIKDKKLVDLLREGCVDDGSIPINIDEYSLLNLDFSKLLDVSPVGYFTIVKYVSSSNDIHISKTFSSSNDIQVSKEFMRSAEFEVRKVSANSEVLQVNDNEKHDSNESGTDNQIANPVTIISLSSPVVGSGSQTANVSLLKINDGENVDQ